MKRHVSIALILTISLFAATPIYAAPSGEMYGDALGRDWQLWYWPSGSSYNLSGSGSFRGSFCTAVTLAGQWAGVQYHTNGYFHTGGYSHLTLAVKNTGNANSIIVFAVLANGAWGPYVSIADYAEDNQLPVGAYRWVRIPLSVLNIGNRQITDIVIQTANTGTGSLCLDEVRFEAHVRFYEGVQAQAAPGVGVYAWGATQTRPPVNSVLSVSFTQAWGGVQFILKTTGVVSPDYGHLTLKVKAGSSSQHFFAYFMDAGGNSITPAVRLADYLVNHVHSTSVLEPIYVPIQALLQGAGGQVNISRLVIESNIAGTAQFDDIRLAEDFLLPLPGGKSWYLTCDVGGACECTDPSPDPFHAVNAAYYSLDFAPRTYEDGGGATTLSNVPILASASGKVIEVNYTDPNGWYVVIDHDFDGDVNTGITTWHLHLVPGSINVVVGQVVKRGYRLGIMGTSGTSSTGIHIHYQYKQDGFRTRDSAPMLHYMEADGLQIEYDYAPGCRLNSPPTGFYFSSNYERQ
jgi:hypothetical protein